MWTLCGMPADQLAALQGANGLPLGVQLVGPRHGDARLLRTARWLAARVATGEKPKIRNVKFRRQIPVGLFIGI